MDSTAAQEITHTHSEPRADHLCAATYTEKNDWAQVSSSTKQKKRAQQNAVMHPRCIAPNDVTTTCLKAGSLSKEDRTAHDLCVTEIYLSLLKFAEWLHGSVIGKLGREIAQQTLVPSL